MCDDDISQEVRRCVPREMRLSYRESFHITGRNLTNDIETLADKIASMQDGSRRDSKMSGSDDVVPSNTLASQFARGKFRAPRMFGVVMARVAVAIEAENDSIIKIV